MYHISIPAHCPGLLIPLFKSLGFKNIKGGNDPEEKVEFMDPDGKVLFEVQHITSPLHGSSISHIGIISNDTKVRKKACTAIRSFQFHETKRYGRSAALTNLVGTVRIGKGSICVEISSSSAHK